MLNFQLLTTDYVIGFGKNKSLTNPPDLLKNVECFRQA
jgi:hypothetical protein